MSLSTNHKWQYPTMPRSFVNSCFVPGSRRPMVPSILSGPILHWPLLINCDRYHTSMSANCNLFFEIWSPWLPKKFIKPTVMLITSPNYPLLLSLSSLLYFLSTLGCCYPMRILIRRLNISHQNAFVQEMFTLPVVNTYKIVVVLMDCIVLKHEKLLK
jgi:hypothetical protein